MATVTGFTATRMLAIEAASVVSGIINEIGHLILTTYGGSEIDAGYVIASVPDASETVKGLVELATVIEAVAGTDTNRAVTPAGLAAAITTAAVPDATDTIKGKVELATDEEAIAGVSTTLAVTPHGLAATVSAATAPDATSTLKGVVELATNIEVITGTDSVRAVTPDSLALAITTDKLATDAVTTIKIADGQITDAKLSSDSVITSKILDANVTNAKLAAMLASTIKGRISSDGPPQDLTIADVLTLLGIEPVQTYGGFTITSATGTNPTKGDSTYNARYAKIAGYVFMQFEITIGSSFNPGSGNYRFPLPVTNTGGGAGGIAMIADVSPFTVWTGTISCFANELEIYRVIDTGTTTVPLNATSISWNTGDVIRGALFYPYV